jgi:RNA polymerase sigma-70 factor (ECF subfamily)
MVFSWEVARDLAQESFLKLWKGRKNIIKSIPVFTLLYRIAINLSIDYLRKKTIVNFEHLSEFNFNNSPNINNEFNTILADCCKKLNPKQRAVFNLRDMEGLTFEEISDILQTNIGNIRSNLHLARKNIRQILFEVYQIDQEYFNEM